MPRNYQPKTKNTYYVDHDLYMQAFYMIRGYDDLKKRKIRVLHGSPPPPDGMPKSRGISSPTEYKARILATIDSQIEAIESTIGELLNKYKNTCTGDIFDPYNAFCDYHLFCFYRSDPKKDMSPSTKTWNRYRCEFAYNVLKKLYYF